MLCQHMRTCKLQQLLMIPILSPHLIQQYQEYAGFIQFKASSNNIDEPVNDGEMPIWDGNESKDQVYEMGPSLGYTYAGTSHAMQRFRIPRRFHGTHCS